MPATIVALVNHTLVVLGEVLLPPVRRWRRGRPRPCPWSCPSPETPRAARTGSRTRPSRRPGASGRGSRAGGAPGRRRGAPAWCGARRASMRRGRRPLLPGPVRGAGSRSRAEWPGRRTWRSSRVASIERPGRWSAGPARYRIPRAGKIPQTCTDGMHVPESSEHIGRPIDSRGDALLSIRPVRGSSIQPFEQETGRIPAGVEDRHDMGAIGVVSTNDKRPAGSATATRSSGQDFAAKCQDAREPIGSMMYSSMRAARRSSMDSDGSSAPLRRLPGRSPAGGKDRRQPRTARS